MILTRNPTACLAIISPDNISTFPFFYILGQYPHHEATDALNNQVINLNISYKVNVIGKV
jgi:hypothetical protein